MKVTNFRIEEIKGKHYFVATSEDGRNWIIAERASGDKNLVPAMEVSKFIEEYGNE